MVVIIIKFNICNNLNYLDICLKHDVVALNYDMYKKYGLMILPSKLSMTVMLVQCFFGTYLCFDDNKRTGLLLYANHLSAGFIRLSCQLSLMKILLKLTYKINMLKSLAVIEDLFWCIFIWLICFVDLIKFGNIGIGWQA